MPRASYRALSLFASVGGIVAGAFISFYVFHATESVAALLFMLWALLVGAVGKRLEAVFTSFAAAVCLDYWFIPPIFKITISSVSGWIGLAVFLTASLLACTVSSALRRQRDELAQSQAASERLHALSRALLLSDRGSDMRRMLVNKCMELFDFEEAVLFELATGEFSRSSSQGAVHLDDLRRVAMYTSPETMADGTHIIPVALGNKIFGSLAYRGKELPHAAMHSLSNTLATGLAQTQAHEASHQAEAVRRSEELKSVMIDALAHDLKTPLTAIEMAAETLIQTPALPHDESAALQREIWQAAQSLRQLVHGAIHLARIDAKRLRLEARPISVTETIEAAVQQVAERASLHTVITNISVDIPPVLADGELLIQAIKQLVDNALKYSPARSTVTISAHSVDGLIAMSVRDQGPGLTELEQSRVFEKFYRGRHDGSAIQGTGMGLAIAKEIAEAHGGAVSVESQVGKGTRFTITLKAAIMEQPA